MKWWQQWIALGLALIPFALCFIPSTGVRNAKEQLTRLLRFPVFWLGGLFLLYCFIGALNYSWEYTVLNDGKAWQMKHLPADEYVHWLPQGVEVPVNQMSPWRVMGVYFTGLLIACSVWLGLTRMRSVEWIVSLIAINATAIALLSILQILSESEKIYWLFEPDNSQFLGTFHYRNHGVVYLYLGLAAACSAAFFHWRRQRDYALRSSPAPLFLFFAVVIAISVFMAGSRGGILFGGFVCAVAVLAFLAKAIHSGKQGVIALGLVAVALLLSLYFMWPIMQRAVPELKVRWAQTEKTITAYKEEPGFVDRRTLVTKATLDMWEERPWLGWGAGSYRYIFTKFQWNYQELYYKPWSIRAHNSNPDRWDLVHARFYYAHNDWAQFLAEYGLVGTTLLCGCIGFWVLLGIRYILELKPEVVMLFAGPLAMLLHGLVDFPFWNPALFFTFVVVIALAGMMPYLSAQRRRGSYA